MHANALESIIDSYRASFQKHGSGPAAGQWSPEGQRFRFARLTHIGALQGKKILDLGCGIGDFYPYLLEHVGAVNYTGIDIVPEVIAYAANQHPSGRFLCCNVLTEPVDDSFEYVLISGAFNAPPLAAPTDFLKAVLARAFALCTVGLGFNFLSTYNNFSDPHMNYHDPLEVLQYCLASLTRKVTLHHHYERCDVAVFAYR
jgi:SAM-dependent methyltransferase